MGSEFEGLAGAWQSSRKLFGSEFSFQAKWLVVHQYVAGSAAPILWVCRRAELGSCSSDDLETVAALKYQYFPQARRELWLNAVSACFVELTVADPAGLLCLLELASCRLQRRRTPIADVDPREEALLRRMITIRPES